MAASDNEVYIGIDLGTTQSTAAYMDPQSGEVIPITGSDSTSQYASVLLFQHDPHHPENKVLYGNTAANVPPSEYHVKEVKRFVAVNYNELSDELKNEFPIEEATNERGEPCVEFVLSDPQTDEELRFSPEELLAIQIAHIKEIVLSRCADCKFTRVVMTVPSSFTDNQIEALKTAYKLAGINVLTVMKEPSAAVYEYRKLTGKSFTKAIVIDIGGGTTDVCVCEQRGERTIVRGNGGDPLLGGSDFDKIMMDMILERLEEDGYEGIDNFKMKNRDGKIKKNEKKKNINRLRAEAERVKKELSTKREVEIQLDKLLPKGEYEGLNVIISRADFEERIREKGLLERIKACIDKSLKEAKTTAGAIQTVILVGGVTMMPLIRETVSEKFGVDKIVREERYDPLLAVAKGATRYARDYKGMENTSGQEASADLIETIPVGIGAEGSQGKMEWIAKKDEEAPIQWSKMFQTISNNQDTMEFDIYKGESSFASSNEYLGTYTVANLPKRPRGEVRCTYYVTIERTGNMKVSAQVEGTDGKQQEMDVDMGFGRTANEVDEMAAKIIDYFPQ